MAPPLQIARANQIRQAGAEIISISSGDEGSEPAPAPNIASFGSAQQRDIEVISISSDDEDTEPAPAQAVESDRLSAQPATHLQNQQRTWDLTNIGERITQHIDSPQPVDPGVDIPESADFLSPGRQELPVRYTPFGNATGSGTRWTAVRLTPSTPRPGILDLASPAFEPLEYTDHDAISDSIVLEADDLRIVVDSENGNPRIFSAGGPFLPQPPASQAPLVIIPSIRFSAGRDLCDIFFDEMVDRAVEAASSLITAVLERPALIYPWIRICPCSKA
ncbi:hypothetical protein LA080_009563 [Diaporthe eres]|nr:hypothetical protein LA080_009563 [Diaporthe eres]